MAKNAQAKAVAALLQIMLGIVRHFSISVHSGEDRTKVRVGQVELQVGQVALEVIQVILEVGKVALEIGQVVEVEVERV